MAASDTCLGALGSQLGGRHHYPFQLGLRVEGQAWGRDRKEETPALRLLQTQHSAALSGPCALRPPHQGPGEHTWVALLPPPGGALG